MKKDQLNKKLYQIHLEVDQEWSNAWHIIRDKIHESINKDMVNGWLCLTVTLTNIVRLTQRYGKH
jgi:predicted Co/Zn/Cd cation transporter (cation efflux family)